MILLKIISLAQQMFQAESEKLLETDTTSNKIFHISVLECYIDLSTIRDLTVITAD